jgi:hypothetical protein
MPRRFRRQKIRYVDPLLVSIPEFARISGFGDSFPHVRSVRVFGFSELRLWHGYAKRLHKEAVIMRGNNAASRLRPVRREAGELSDTQIEKLLEFGRREAEIIDELVDATRADDRDHVWQLARTLVEIEDEAKQQ